MSYQQAFEAAGATVHAAEYFGSYQGDAVFDITFEGKRGYLVVSYGSCSGCDAFESAFGWDDREECDDHRWTGVPEGKTCVLCVAAKALYQSKLADFGRRYLDDLQDGQAVVERYTEDMQWDHDAKYIVTWVTGRELQKQAEARSPGLHIH